MFRKVCFAIGAVVSSLPFPAHQDERVTSKEVLNPVGNHKATRAKSPKKLLLFMMMFSASLFDPVFADVGTYCQLQL